MSELLDRSWTDTTVIVQIEEPGDVAATAEIAGVDGVDGLFTRPSDLKVAYGADDMAAEKAYMTFVHSAGQAVEWARYGFTAFFVASGQNLMTGAANTQADGIHNPGP